MLPIEIAGVLGEQGLRQCFTAGEPSRKSSYWSILTKQATKCEKRERGEGELRRKPAQANQYWQGHSR